MELWDQTDLAARHQFTGEEEAGILREEAIRHAEGVDRRVCEGRRHRGGTGMEEADR